MDMQRQAEESPTDIREFFSAGGRSAEGLDALVPSALSAIRKYLGMDVAFLSEFSRGRRVFRFVDSKSATPVVPGGSDPLEASFCQRVVDGRLPELMHDARAIPAAMALPVTAALPVGAHLSIPVRLADGSVYGTFCAFSSTPDHTLNDRDLGMMRVFAEWIASLLDQQGVESNERKAARGRVEAVLAGNGLTTVYQPIYDLASEAISGFECLSRFAAEPKRSPDLWFAEAGRVGLGAQLEMKAIEVALRGLRRLPDSVYVSVNVSPRLLADHGLRSVLDALPPSRVVLELTEHETISEYGEVLDALKSFSERGIRVAVDDAGAGYSSFKHILEIMPAFIKLDISLTRGIDKDAARRALTAAMVRFCNETDSTLVAEGIETAAELQTLRSLGVGAGQGYFLQRPQPLEVAESLAFGPLGASRVSAA